VKAIAEQAVRSFGEEAERSKILDTKTGLLLGATGTIVGIAVGTLAKPPDVFARMAARPIEQATWLALYYLLLLSAVLLLVAAVSYFFRTLDRSWVPYIDPGSFAQPDWYVQRPVTFYEKLTEAYVVARRANIEEMSRREAFYVSGQHCLYAGLVLLVFVVGLLAALTFRYPALTPTGTSPDRSVTSDAERGTQTG
jgi:hypothetical protein